MNLFVLILFGTLVSTSIMASKHTSETLYIVEAGALYVTGQAAEDLYNDMEKKEVLISSTKTEERKEKVDGPIRCEATYIRSAAKSVIKVSKVKCTVTISPEVVGPRY